MKQIRITPAMKAMVATVGLETAAVVEPVDPVVLRRSIRTVESGTDSDSDNVSDELWVSIRIIRQRGKSIQLNVKVIKSFHV